MEHFRFAICIVLPGATSTDVVKAAMAHNVHIIDKEPFDITRDYHHFPQVEALTNGARIFPLFIGPDESVLVENEETREEALKMLLNAQHTTIQ